MTVLFALLAAACYGVSDFAGGLACRGTRALTVLMYNFPGGALVMFALLPFFPGSVSAATLAWSVGAGIAGLCGVGLLYSALAVAPMNVVSPVTAVLSAAVPVLVGVATGERPTALVWVGIALGLVAVVLIARAPCDGYHATISRRALLMTLAAGLGFGVYFVLLSRTSAGSGVWPVVIARVTAAVVIVPMALRTRAVQRLRGGGLGLAVASGVLDAGANLFFLLASRAGYLTISGTIAALYPAGTVLLAIGILKERTLLAQRVGFGLAVVAVVCIAR